MTKWTWFLIAGVALLWYLMHRQKQVTGAAGGMTTGTTAVTNP